MTEDEAKTKWCPFARTIQKYSGFTNSIVANRNSNGEFESSHCLASKCMAWRWKLSPELATINKKYNKDHPTNILDDQASGYCGLASR